MPTSSSAAFCCTLCPTASIAFATTVFSPMAPAVTTLLCRTAGLRTSPARTPRLDWVVYAKPPFGGPEQVLAYLGRYTHRVAIANSRLLSLADGKIRFTWKDYRADGKTKVMTLDADEFIRRFLLHALPDGFHRIRHYGFLANGSRGDSLALCRRLLEARATSAVREPADNHIRGDRPLTAADFAICPD